MKNGHDKAEEAEVHIENPSTIRSRRSKIRKRMGIVVLRDVVIEPDLVQALVA